MGKTGHTMHTFFKDSHTFTFYCGSHETWGEKRPCSLSSFRQNLLEKELSKSVVQYIITDIFIPLESSNS